MGRHEQSKNSAKALGIAGPRRRSRWQAAANSLAMFRHVRAEASLKITMDLDCTTTPAGTRSAGGRAGNQTELSIDSPIAL